MKLLVLLAVFGCGSKDAGGGGKKAADIPPPFTVKVNKVEKLDVVAPNETYLKNGLGKKPPAGKVWICVQLSVTNIGGTSRIATYGDGTTHKVMNYLPPSQLIDAKGTATQVSVDAAGSYNPESWRSDLGDVGANETKKKDDCFAVDPANATGMKLVYDDEWKLTVDLPNP